MEEDGRRSCRGAGAELLGICWDRDSSLYRQRRVLEGAAQERQQYAGMLSVHSGV